MDVHLDVTDLESGGYAVSYVARRGQLITESQRHVALLGNLEPVIRMALLSTCPRSVIPLESPSRATAIIEEALGRNARAVIITRTEVSELEEPKGNLIVIGVSSGSWDVMIRRETDQLHLSNPTPEDIWNFIIRGGEDQVK